MGAWIETIFIYHYEENSQSHPTWVRGLKLEVYLHSDINVSVAPYVGAWIETNVDVCLWLCT